MLLPKNKILGLLLLLGLVCQPHSLCAQQRRPDGPRSEIGRQHRGPGHRPDFNPQEFRQKFEKHIRSRVPLTDEEAKRYFALNQEMRDRQRALRDQIHGLLHKVEVEKLSDSRCDEIYRQVLALRKQSADVEAYYQKRFRTFLPSRKLLSIMKAEREFGKQTFREGPPRK